MRIFINALSARQGGGQTYLRHLLEKFPEDEDKIFIIAPESLEIPNKRKNIEKIKIPQSIITNPFIRAAWEMLIQPILLRFLKVNVLFCPGGSVTGSVPRGCKIVTTFQNMMPFDRVQRKKYPMGYMRSRNWLLERKLLKSMIRSDLVIYISEFARSVIEKKSGGKVKKSVVIPHGINPDFRLDPSRSLELLNWLPKEGYILYVSILDVYKSQVEVIKAYYIFKKKVSNRKIPKLVLVGPEYAPYGKIVRQTILNLGLTSDVIVKSAVQNLDLPAVYQNAIINIFASQTENCPFILLEALAAGRPLLVSSSPPMPEFAGDAAIYFDATLPNDLALKIENLLNDPDLMNKLSKNALDRSFLYNWDEAAQRTWQSIKNFV